MRRREFVAMLGLALAGAPRIARAEQRRRRIGYLSGGSKARNGPHSLAVLSASLADLGWRDGETIEIIDRWSDGDAALLPMLARELVEAGADVMVVTGTTETRSMQAATATVPIVFIQIAVDPVTSGFVDRIAQPGRNLTGFMQGPQFLWSKRLELLSDLLGARPQRLAWLGNPNNAGSEPNWRDAREAAERAGRSVRRIDVGSAADIERALTTLDDVDALLVQYDFLMAVESKLVARLARARGVPAIYENRMQAVDGGLIAYGGDLRENFRQGAGYVHRILNGASPARLPVVQASRFELVVNLATAKAMGIALPESLLVRADELIE